MTGTVTVYGATGFSGGALAGRLARAGHDLLVAGRHQGRVRGLAQSLGVSHRTFSLGDPADVQRGLAGVDVLVNAAGPFQATARPLIEGCISAGTHYLDLSGEWPVFAMAQHLGPVALGAGVMVMPGVGFSIVVSDCLMARAVRQVPEATLLRVAGSQPALISRGSVRSVLGLISGSVLVRRGGALHQLPVGRRRARFNYGAGLRDSIAASLPEVITGQQTTGVANIEVYLEAPIAFELACRAGAVAADLFGERALHGALAPLGAGWPERPSPAAQQRAFNSVVVEAVDPWRRVTRFGMFTGDGYGVTTTTAHAIVERVLGGWRPPGFQTPAGVYGADFVTDLGCAWPFDAEAGTIPPRHPGAV